MSILAEIFSTSLLSIPTYEGWKDALVVILLIVGLIFIEWPGREDQFAIERFGLNWPRPVRWAFYSSMIFLIGMLMETTETPFLYIQF